MKKIYQTKAKTTIGNTQNDAPTKPKRIMSANQIAHIQRTKAYAASNNISYKQALVALKKS